jgi:hypothetical protein
VIHLGSALNLRRIVVAPFVFARFRSCGRACSASLSIAANHFFARPSRTKLEGPRADSGMREVERCTDVTNAVVGEADGAQCWQRERHRFGRGLEGRGA